MTMLVIFKLWCLIVAYLLFYYCQLLYYIINAIIFANSERWIWLLYIRNCYYVKRNAKFFLALKWCLLWIQQSLYRYWYLDVVCMGLYWMRYVWTTINFFFYSINLLLLCLVFANIDCCCSYVNKSLLVSICRGQTQGLDKSCTTSWQFIL